MTRKQVFKEERKRNDDAHTSIDPQNMTRERNTQYKSSTYNYKGAVRVPDPTKEPNYQFTTK